MWITNYPWCIVADRSACAALSIWQFVQSVEDCLLHHSQTCCLCWMCHLKKCSNLLDDAKNNTWHVAATLIKKLKNKDNITQAELKQFYKEVESFVSATISKPLEKISVSTKIVRNACIFNPCLMSAIPVDVFIKRIKILIGYLVDGDWVEAHVWNKMITLFSLFIASSYTNFSSFKQKNMHFDEFFFGKYLIKDSHPELVNIVELITVLFHDLTAVKQNFTLGKSFITDIIELSIENKKIVKDHMHSNRLTRISIQISKYIFSSFKEAMNIILRRRRRRGEKWLLRKKAERQLSIKKLDQWKILLQG